MYHTHIKSDSYSQFSVDADLVGMDSLKVGMAYHTLPTKLYYNPTIKILRFVALMDSKRIIPIIVTCSEKRTTQDAVQFLQKKSILFLTPSETDFMSLS